MRKSVGFFCAVTAVAMACGGQTTGGDGGTDGGSVDGSDGGCAAGQGGPGQPCCGVERICKDTNEFCQGIPGVCTPCGGAGQPCCPFRICNTNEVCQGATTNGNPGVCAPCGDADQPCCDLSACNNGGCCNGMGSMDRCTAAGTNCPINLMTCMNGGCGNCGALGQMCCGNNTCTQGGTSCQNGTCSACGGTGQVCCPCVGGQPCYSCANPNDSCGGVLDGGVLDMKCGPGGN